MTVGVHVALLAAALVAAPPGARRVAALPDRVGAALALRLQVLAGVVLAGASTVALGLLVLDALARVPAVAALDGWSVPVLTGVRPWAPMVGAGAAALAAVLAVLLVRRTATVARTFRDVWAVAPPGRHHGDLVTVADDAPYACAVPGRGRRPGTVVASTAMLETLGERERAALLAHERAHLAGHHHAVLALGALVAALNPLLTGLRTAMVYAVERRADEVAASAVGDRAVVAGAIGRAALAARDRPIGPGDPTVTPGVAAGPLPRRVAALLDTNNGNARPDGFVAVLVLVAVIAAGAGLYAGLDMHALIELSEGGRS